MHKKISNLRKKTILIQTKFREYIARKKFLNLRQKSIMIQKIYKGYKTIKIKEIKNSTIIIQKLFKGYLKRKEIKNLKEKTIKIQKIIRGQIIRTKVNNLIQTIKNFVNKLIFQTLKENYPKLIQTLRLIVKLKKLEEVLREESNNFELLKIENEEDKLMKMLGKGQIIGIRTFPRPYCEIGNNLKVLRKRLEKLNYDIGDVEFVKNLDIKYSGKTSQLIIDYPWKNEMLNKILNNDYKNLEGINFEETMKLVDDVYETKTFLKSKNISSKLKKKKKIIHRKMKVVNDDWNYFSKIYYLKKNNQMKQILLIQKYISKFLWKISFIKKENEKPENKIKSFYNLIKKCIIKHARNYIFQIEKKKKKNVIKFF